MSYMIFLVLLCGSISANELEYLDIYAAPHSYRERAPADRFTQLKVDFESGRVPLDRSNEKAFVTSLLKTLEVPVTSQMLVFSTTSLQLSLISPSNPRALYFNEEIYVGYVPGGRIEIVTLDPELGGIFYIFDIPRDDGPLRIERSGRCMNCHSGADTGYIPGLVIKSVVPGVRGGSLDSLRVEQTGHQIPFEQRFGGWYLTGKHGITNHWGNIIGQFSPDGIAKRFIQPGEMFDFSRYPVASSDLLPQLLHEHQAGFVNRVLQAGYRVRSDLHRGEVSIVQKQKWNSLAGELARYILFADEVPLPAGGVEADPAYKKDFMRNKRPAGDGSSLKDFDLVGRLFKHRCSYMINSSIFASLPVEFKAEVYAHLRAALTTDTPRFAYLSGSEKAAIRGILKETLADLPPDF